MHMLFIFISPEQLTALQNISSSCSYYAVQVNNSHKLIADHRIYVYESMSVDVILWDRAEGGLQRNGQYFTKSTKSFS